MAQPDFTPEELYLINSMKLPAALQKSFGYVLGYILGGIAVFGVGAFFNNIFMMIVGFMLIVFFRLNEEKRHKDWLPIYRSIFEKYEAALRDEKILDNKG